jgi:hypothetical protein
MSIFPSFSVLMFNYVGMCKVVVSDSKWMEKQARQSRTGGCRQMQLIRAGVSFQS